MVPWMLQVPDYTRAMVMASGEVSHEHSGEAIRLRRWLASLVDKAVLVVYLPEQALRTPVCSGRAMVNQMHHLLRISVMKSMSLRIVPDLAGLNVLMSAPFVMLESPGYRVRPAVYQEVVSGGVFLEDACQVVACENGIETLSSIALDENASSALLRAVARESDVGDSSFEMAMPESG
jgi:hypothetical protein